MCIYSLILGYMARCCYCTDNLTAGPCSASRASVEGSETLYLRQYPSQICIRSVEHAYGSINPFHSIEGRTLDPGNHSRSSGLLNYHQFNACYPNMKSGSAEVQSAHLRKGFKLLPSSLSGWSPLPPPHPPPPPPDGGALPPLPPPSTPPPVSVCGCDGRLVRVLVKSSGGADPCARTDWRLRLLWFLACGL